MSNRRARWDESVRASTRLFVAICLAAVLTYFLPGLRQWGIVPRTVSGVVGIAFAPLLHANAGHLSANALPLFVLMTLLFADRSYRPGWTLAVIWVCSGLGTWLIGRGGTVHIGASSIIYGLAAYLVASGFLRRNWRTALVAVLVLLLYGGAVYGLLPRRGPISWEGHLSGAVAGVLAARWRGRRANPRAL